MFGHWSHTGFGVVTQELAQRFVGLEHDVRVVAQNHRGEPLTGVMNGRVWSAGIRGDLTGGNVSQEAANGSFWRMYNPADIWKPDVVLMIADAGTLINYIGQPRKEYPDQLGPFGTEVPTFNYVPIEGDNLNPSWRDIWKRIQPIAMSQYGREQIATHLGYDVPMVYHGVDTEHFYPVSRINPIHVAGTTFISKVECKRGGGFDPERIMLLRTDRLVERKQFHVLLASVLPVFQQHPDVDLVLHTHPVQPPLNLYEEVARIPEEYWGRIKVTGAHDTWVGLGKAELNALYNAADIYVSPTAGEGFGLTLAESLACEVPVVTTDFAAGPEIMAPGGIAVPPLHDVYGEQVRIHSTYGMDWRQPDPRATTAAIIRLLEKPSLRRELGRMGRLHIQKTFSWDTAAAQMIGLFELAVEAWKTKPE